MFGRKNNRKGRKPIAKIKLKEKGGKKGRKLKNNPPTTMSKCVPCPSKEEKPKLPCSTSHSALPLHFPWGGLHTPGSCRETALIAVPKPWVPTLLSPGREVTNGDKLVPATTLFSTLK